MTMSDSKLVCHTAKFKLKEANYFLEKIKSQEIQVDNNASTFNLNAFVISSNSVIEYVESDFVYVMIKPHINWREWIYEKPRNAILENHEQSKTLKNFRGFYLKQKKELLKIPLANYFRYKRNKIAHRRWDGIKNELLTEYPDGRKESHLIGLESGTTLYFAQQDPSYDIDICYPEIPREEQIILLTRLQRESAILILNEYLQHLQGFINKFENKDFFD